MDRIRLANDALRLTLTQQGAAVEEFAAVTSHGSVPIFFRGKQQPLCFPLVPFSNRLRGNGFIFEGEIYRFTPNTAADPLYIHGDGWLSSWTIADVSQTGAVLTLDHSGKDAPYSYRAEQHFSLESKALRIRLVVTNTGLRRMPFGLGLHPYLPLTPRTEIAFEATHLWEQDAAFLPTRRQPAIAEWNFSQIKALPHRWANMEFEGWLGDALVRWPETGSELRITTEPKLDRCMLFVSSSSFDPGYQDDWFCFEPMTHGVDAHRRDDGGLTPLEPGETLAMEATFAFRMPH